MIPFSSWVLVPSDILISQVGGESVILNLKSEHYFGLDEMGTEMWAAITNSESIQTAYEKLLNEYNVEPEQLRRDLEDLLEKLVAHGLVEISDAQLA
jgi:cell division septum initiation protein DivIVA